METYEFLQKLNNNELVQIIEAMIDFEEVAEAFCILKDRKAEKALELGIQIIEQDRGDEYLQAAIWDFLFYENKTELIHAVSRRKTQIGRTLLDDIIIDLTDSSVNISRDFLRRIIDTYNAIQSEAKNEMRCNYEIFTKIYGHKQEK